MKFFDYVWYRVFGYYTSKKDDTAKISASLTLSLGQLSNVLTFLFPLDYFLKVTILNKAILIIISFVILLFNILRFRNEKMITISKIWGTNSVNERKNKGLVVIFYLIFSILTMILTAGYIGYLRNS